jgi:PAS domain S-box-containing protein
MNIHEHFALLHRSSFAGIFDRFDFPVTLANSRKRFVYANKAFCRYYGYSKKEIVGLCPRILIPSSFSERQMHEVFLAMDGQRKAWEGLIPNLNARGETVLIYLITLPLRPAGGSDVAGYFGVSCEAGDQARLLSSLTTHLIECALCASAMTPGTNAVTNRRRRGDRQDEVMRLARMGYSTKEIAAMMGNAVSTVAFVRWKMNKRKSN